MSDTPRVDAYVFASTEAVPCLLALARTLERELAEALAKLDDATLRVGRLQGHKALAEARIAALREALIAVMLEWVNGRQVGDGISMTIKQQVVAAMGGGVPSDVHGTRTYEERNAGFLSVPIEVVRMVWSRAKARRDYLAGLVSSDAAGDAQKDLDALKAAGFTDHLPTLAEVQEAWRNKSSVDIPCPQTEESTNGGSDDRCSKCGAGRELSCCSEPGCPRVIDLTVNARCTGEKT